VERGSARRGSIRREEDGKPGRITSKNDGLGGECETGRS